MEQKKIEELKKALGFGLMLATYITENKYVGELINSTDKPHVFATLIAEYLIEYYYEVYEYVTSNNIYNVDSATKLIELTYKEYIEYKKSEKENGTEKN